MNRFTRIIQTLKNTWKQAIVLQDKFDIASACLAIVCVHNNATLKTEIQYSVYCHATPMEKGACYWKTSTILKVASLLLLSYSPIAVTPVSQKASVQGPYSVRTPALDTMAAGKTGWRRFTWESNWQLLDHDCPLTAMIHK